LSGITILVYSHCCQIIEFYIYTRFHHCCSSSASTSHRSSGSRNSSQALNGPSDSFARYPKDAVPNIVDRKIASEDKDKDKQSMISNAAERVQPIKPNHIHQNPASVASSSSAVGVYSSSTDPVHVPSPDSRSSSVVGAIRREVGVVGVRRQPSDNKVKQSFAPSSSYVAGKDGTSADSFQPVGAVLKTEQFSQTKVTEPSLSGVPVSRPSVNNQYNGRPHQQLVGHQRGSSLKWLYQLCF